MQAVILAAGRGTRLRQLTERRSKAMLPIAGKPMIGRVMELIAGCGVDEFIVVANPLDLELTGYLEKVQMGRIQVVFQPQPHGAAEALLYAAQLITGDFVLSACDNLVPEFDLQKMLNSWQNSTSLLGLLALQTIPSTEIPSAGIVELRGEWVTRIIEKPRLQEAPSNIASLPLYCFTPDLLKYLPHVKSSPRGEYELQDAIQMLIAESGSVRGYLTKSRLTLTSEKDLLTLNRFYLVQQGNHALQIDDAVPAGTVLLPPVQIEAGAIIGDKCTIGPEVFLEAGCRLGDGVTIQRSIALRGADIPAGATVIGKVAA